MDSWKSQRLTCKRKAPSQNCTVHGATSELAFHRWPGSRAGRSTEKMAALQEPLCWKLLTLSSLRRAPQIRPSACPCKMSTRLEVRAVLLWAVATLLAFILAGLIKRNTYTEILNFALIPMSTRNRHRTSWQSGDRGPETRHGGHLCSGECDHWGQVCRNAPRGSQWGTSWRQRGL